MSRTWTRWAPTGAAAAVVAGLALGTQPAVAGDLPERTPQEVLALVAEREVEAFSGTFEQTADLGLPEVPASLGGVDEAEGMAGAAGLLAVVTGSHSGRLFVGGPGTARLQVMDTFAQRDVVVDGTEVWSYDSAADTATRVTLPDPPGPGAYGPSGVDRR
ncbi:hypothetical protein PU560_05620, partial [Georgenia sp. 10Sc9-8]|nr:hypothetical protein [Georgenia halotolerans]